MIYTGLGRVGEIADVKAHGGADVAEVYGGINESNPIYYKTRTLTGTSPLTFKGLGQPLKDYAISGNTVQNGTPTPSDPVDVVGCGMRTGNLFSSSPASGVSPGIGLTWAYNGSTLSLSGTAVGTGGRNTLKSSSFVLEAGQYTFTADTPIQLVIVNESTSTSIVSTNTRTFTISDDCTVHVGVNIREGDIGKTIDNKIGIMLNAGSTPLPYELYGYKLPLTINNTEYPIYLGEVQTRRKIKKYVFTGTESGWNISQDGRFWIGFGGYKKIGNVIYCTHYAGIENQEDTSSVANGQICFYSSSANRMVVCDNVYETVNAFKTYLQQQYAAGTPVTVWYVLAEPETDIVNEPLHKIGDYADSISFAQAGVTIPTVAGTNTFAVDTTVHPSEVSITGNIKEVST